jgi:hypothetical protein
MRWLVQSNEACPPPSATLACCDRIQDAFLPITTSSTSAHLLTAGTSCRCGSTIHVCRGRPLRCPAMVSTNDSLLRPSPGAVHSYCFFFANSAPNGPWLPTAHINPTTRPGRVSEPVNPDCWMELVQVPLGMQCDAVVTCRAVFTACAWFPPICGCSSDLFRKHECLDAHVSWRVAAQLFSCKRHGLPVSVCGQGSLHTLPPPCASSAYW